ncbi:hypothetical protein PMI16_02097 [Herbaspirillum sp. CF444]|uniref:hypothetical protein n=1 Tax=Herbaspirillum sp. CF444 TaxID=1144319 RepID=UPI0002726336|nr:hypothetical protein [Herbaspirillum sp. CF444]EJL88949.1 hypothetical protein PMI16_02097 [Herbaspirillum sp. CF444]
MGNGISDVGRGGYFRHVEDNTQLKTAQRSTFQATASNKISNWFAKKNDLNAQDIGAGLKSLRQASLSTRKALSATSSGLQRFSAKFGVGAQIDRFKARGNETARADVAERRQQKLDGINDRAELKKARLEWKEKINRAAPEKMAETIAQADEEFQALLASKNYEELGGLSGIAPEKEDPTYMINADGHRVRTSDQKLPFVARKVAEMGSRQYENGVTGVERAIKRGAQYGAIGLSSGVQLAKQGVYTVAAKMSSHESEERDNFLRHAGRARDMRRLNSASLKGNQALTEKFYKVNDEQEATRAEMFERAGYEEIKSIGGVAPPKTRYSARKMDEYFSDPDDKKPKMRRVAAAYVGFANLGSKMSRSYHTKMVSWVSNHEDADTPRMQQARLYHENKSFKANFKIDTSLAALDGRLRGGAPNVEPESEAEYQDPETQYTNRRSPSPVLSPSPVNLSPSARARFLDHPIVDDQEDEDEDQGVRLSSAMSRTPTPPLLDPRNAFMRPEDGEEDGDDDFYAKAG